MLETVGGMCPQSLAEHGGRAKRQASDVVDRELGHNAWPGDFDLIGAHWRGFATAPISSDSLPITEIVKACPFVGNLSIGSQIWL